MESRVPRKVRFLESSRDFSDQSSPRGPTRWGRRRPASALSHERFLPIFTDFLPIFLTFLGDFTPDRLDSRSLETLWEWKNRVILEEYYIFNAAIPLEVE